MPAHVTARRRDPGRTPDAGGPSVMLVSMPFMSLDLGALSVAVLQGELRRAGVRCDAAFLGFDLARAIGAGDYEMLMTEGTLIGEWVFAAALRGRPPADEDLDRLAEANRAWYTFTERSRQQLLDMSDIGRRFVEWAVRARQWDDYDLVGFSSTFQQNVASLALGRTLKQHHPDLPLAYGGSNWQGEMGVALHESFGWVDYAAVGEGEGIIVDLLSAARGEIDPATIPGIVYRRGSESIPTGPAPLNDALDDLAVPDYEDWLTQRRRALVTAERSPTLVFESSRGCWWGEHSHCTFCGLNAEGMASRRKSARRVEQELEELRARTGVNSYMAADTILPTAYFSDLLPSLARTTPRFDLFYEVKTNLTAAKVKALADAGVTRIQPGIESLSDNVLKLIRKGTTGLQNVQVLRWCLEFGIEVDWPILVDVPGDTPADYEDFRRIADCCYHLPAPAQVQKVAIHRFSPFHSTPSELGFTNVRPDPAYRLLYETDESRLARIAYRFVADRVDTDDGADNFRPILATVGRWQDHDGGGLWMRRVGDRLEISDERVVPAMRSELEGWEAEVFEACDRVQTRRRLGRVATGVAEGELDGFLASQVEAGLLLSDHGRYVALPVYRPSRAELEADRPRLTVIPVT